MQLEIVVAFLLYLLVLLTLLTLFTLSLNRSRGFYFLQATEPCGLYSKRVFCSRVTFIQVHFYRCPSCPIVHHVTGRHYCTLNHVDASGN